MNRTVILIFLTLLSTTTFAQVKFGPEAGFNVAMQNRKMVSSRSGSYTETSQPAPGFNLGLIVDLKLFKNLYLQSGAFYYFDNIKYIRSLDFTAYGLGAPKLIEYYRTHQVRVPLYVVYKSGFEGMGRFIAGAGPYATYTFSGKRILSAPTPIYETNSNKVSGYDIMRTQNDMTFGEAIDDDRRKWDYGVGGFMGYESNVGFYFRGTFSYGLADLSAVHAESRNVRNWGFGISIGYLFGEDNW